jgi:DNA-directed RNA polymerase specialized sigma24 family protein
MSNYKRGDNEESLSRQIVVLHAFALRRHFRDVFLLCEIQEMTVSEAAAILNVSAAVVEARLRRARREIGNRVQDNNGGPLLPPALSN